MKIACPNCDTKYALNPDALGTHGRKMKCAKCAHVWTALPKSTSENSSPTRQGAQASLPDQVLPPESNRVQGLSEQSRPNSASQRAETDMDKLPNQNENSDLALWEADSREERAAEEAHAAAMSELSRSADRQRFSRRSDSSAKGGAKNKIRLGAIGTVPQLAAAAGLQRVIRFVKWAHGLSFANQTAVLLALVMPVILVSGLFVGRQFVVRQFPDLASLYAIVGLEVNLYGLQFEDVRTIRRPEGGVAVLIVEGSIRNISSRTKDIPRLHFILSGRNREIFAWHDDASPHPLPAGESTQFRTVLASPPDVADELHVRFLNNDTRLNRL